MSVRMDLSLKYSQKRNFFHFFEQKKPKFPKAEGCRAPPPYLRPAYRGRAAPPNGIHFIELC